MSADQHRIERGAADLPDAVRREIAAHHALYARDPEAAHLWDPIVIGVPGGPVPCLLLHHVGRKSGRKLNSILQYYRHGDEIVIVASKGGLPQHPVWYLNLLAAPDCEVEIGAFRTRAVARPLAGEERARWWRRVTAEQAVQVEYQARTTREIPLVMLELETRAPLRT
ncbi:MAG: nitroreductase family deazaflavin-dependent oxidoreductase [Proteobacteria bacterium]|nr:nitroreductase family deazaflavin-dependent oxidoreductase [Pseudomonadota bacterium]